MKRLDPVEEKFLNTIKENNLINEGDVIVIGVSGGPDSITLLTCLNKYKNKFNCKLIVAHINHLIREDSTEDEQYVENFCKKIDVPVFIKRVDILKLADEWKKGTEETGRIIRYEFFDEIAKKEKANKIAIAHNMNDNAETILLNIIRGSGLSGLEGIQPYKYNKYIRPIINCTREEIEEYCKKNNLMPRIDSTNKENIYKRNIIRNELIPYLKKINPSIVETLSRTSRIVKENNEYIGKQAKVTYERIATETEKTVEFKLADFNSQEKAIQNMLILTAIKRLTGDIRNIEKSNIDDIVKLAQRKIGNKHMVINKYIKIEVKNHLIKISCENT